VGERDADVRALHELVERMEAGWNAGDEERFASVFAEDADYVIVDGTVIKGRPTIARGHQHLFEGPYRGSCNALTVEAVRWVRPDVAVVRVRAHLHFSLPDGTAQEADARSGLVCARDDGRWQVVAFQNTPIAVRQGELDSEEIVRRVSGEGPGG
jgi:uncharacterized protein (TIGR02246 family)